ncbi:MAG: PAS domain S-box protein [Candidatus Bathyarchaeia archaeon]|jgi:PAS domain S-box-containing protein
MLQKQSNLAQMYFELANAFMIAIGSNELITDINGKASEILGYSRLEVKGKNWFDMFVLEKEREDARRVFHDVLKGSLPHVHSKYSLITRQGKQRTFDFHNILVSDKYGKTVGVLSSGTDITEAALSKEVENRLQASLDVMIEGCQIIDYDWRYVYVNEAAARQGKKKKQELLGYTMMQVYPEIDKTEMFSNLRNCMTNRVHHQMDNEFTFPDGSKGWFDLHMEPVPEGVLILSIDITKEKAIEAELTGYRHRLEQVVAQRTAECAETNEKLTRKIQEAQKTEDALKLRATILDNAKEAIFLANIKGDFVYANGAASESYGYSLDEFLNMNIRLLLPPKDASSCDGLFRHIIEKKEASLEMVHLRKNGAEMTVKVYANLVKTVHGQFIVFVIRRLFRR